MSAAARLPRLHVVTDDQIFDRPDFVGVAKQIGNRCGADVAIHLRSRSASARRLYDAGAALRGSGAQLYVNDRVDLAVVLAADGVQLRADSMPIPMARRVMPRGRIGYSAHAVDEAQRAERAGADFLFAGTIYSTATHPDRVPHGTRFLAEMSSGVKVPVIAIGGINESRVLECRKTGAYGVAVIRAVWQAADPAHEAETLLAALKP